MAKRLADEGFLAQVLSASSRAVNNPFCSVICILQTVTAIPPIMQLAYNSKAGNELPSFMRQQEKRVSDTRKIMRQAFQEYMRTIFDEDRISETPEKYKRHGMLDRGAGF